jgi:hypothetical protein
MNDRHVGIGVFHDRIAAGQSHRFKITAAGFADSEFSVKAAAGDSEARRVALRERRGDLRIETQPPGAEVRVDGQARGKSPLTVRGLGAAHPHRVEAIKPGFGAAAAQATPPPDSTAFLQLRLEQGSVGVLVSADPPGSEIRVDGTSQGASPAHASLHFGRHKFTAAHDGYLGAETTLVVDQSTDQVLLKLNREPPGVLVVQGDRVAKIYVDDDLVKEASQNSGTRSLPPGSHRVRVILGSGETVDTTITITSRERATFDYSELKITRRPEGGE